VINYLSGTGVKGDLDEIWDYIAKDSIENADRRIAKLLDAFETIAARPGIGHKREDLVPHGVLLWPVGAYVIVYRATSLPIEIVAITQGSRDIPALLGHRLSG
jgi:plasmid stabilization system protein ParE